MNEIDGQEREAIFAEEALVVDAQVFLHTLMDEKGVSRADLARAMGISRARVTQLFSDECKNFTIRLFARAAHALGERVELDCDHFRCRRTGKLKRSARQASNVVTPAIWHDLTDKEVEAVPLTSNRLTSFLSSRELKAA
jgi:transcriptional regulator with XRE-family HTH domain